MTAAPKRDGDSGERAPTSVAERVYHAAAEDSSLKLAAAFSVSPETVRAGYRLTSKVDPDLIVHDVLTIRDEEGELRPDPLRAYVSFEEPATLALKRVILPAPTFGGGFIVPRHLWRTLPGKGALDGIAVVELPAMEYNPWFRRGRPVYRKALAMRLKLVIEYHQLPESASAEPLRIEVVVPLLEPVPVKRRSDMFEPV